jgi:hypothetical protein
MLVQEASMNTPPRRLLAAFAASMSPSGPWWPARRRPYRRLSSNQSGRCLDVAAGAANGSATQIWDCTGGANQKWTRG